MTDPKKRQADTQQNQADQIPILRPKSRADRAERRQPSTVALSQSGKMLFRERVLGWWRALRTDGADTAVHFYDIPPYTMLVPTKAGESSSAELIYRKSGHSAIFDATLGFYPEDIPLLHEGTVVFTVEKVQMPDGTPCLGVNLATARLAKTEKPAPKRKKKSTTPPSVHQATAEQIQAAMAAAAAASQAERTARIQAQASLKAQAEAQAAQAIAQLQAAQALSQAQAAQAAAVAQLQAQEQVAAAIQTPGDQASSSQAPSSQLPEAEEPPTQE